MTQLALPAFEAGLDAIRQSPAAQGVVGLIVRRPAVDEREVLDEATLNDDVGLEGDTWRSRPSTSTADGKAHPEKQITIMNARVATLIAGDRSRWPLAGDQLYVDFDLSAENLPPGSRIRVGSAVLQVSEHPHRGCKKFSARFGLDALRFVNSDAGNKLNLRGINTFVIEPGIVRPGDVIEKI